MARHAHSSFSRRSAVLFLACALSACASDAKNVSRGDAGVANTGGASHGGSVAAAGATSGGNPSIPTSPDGATSGGSGGRAPSTGGSAPASGGVAGARGSGGSTSSTPPKTCPAADMDSADGGRDTFVANTGKQPVTALTYTNVGATGAYAQVVTGWSKATGCVHDTDGMLCKNTYRTPKQVSGNLAPFDEEMSMVFGGPVELYRIAVYQPSSSGWDRVAYWDPCTTTGLAFAGNKSWYECGGFVESYVTADGTAESDTSVQFAGHLAAGTEVNVMSSAACNGSTASSDCGFSTGLALHGFKGDGAGSKIFATKFRMPIGAKTPAYWILPSQVIRSSQYGCNCRGAGSDPTYKGGCGELDVAEILGGVTTSREATRTSPAGVRSHSTAPWTKPRSSS
jgi:Cell wall protein YJL171C/Tos1, C-terminal/Cell wall protein YJL171C/Tos1, N-terminal